jgi:hypothetical protein
VPECGWKSDSEKIMNWYDVPLGSVRWKYDDERNEVAIYLHTFNLDPKEEWNFKSEWTLDGPLSGPSRPTLGHLQALLDMAKRKFSD